MVKWIGAVVLALGLATTAVAQSKLTQTGNPHWSIVEVPPVPPGVLGWTHNASASLADVEHQFWYDDQTGVFRHCQHFYNNIFFVNFTTQFGCATDTLSPGFTHMRANVRGNSMIEVSWWRKGDPTMWVETFATFTVCTPTNC